MDVCRKRALCCVVAKVYSVGFIYDSVGMILSLEVRNLTLQKANRNDGQHISCEISRVYQQRDSVYVSFEHSSAHAQSLGGSR